MRARPARDGHPGTPVATHILPAGLGEEGRALARMLARAGPAAAGEQYFHSAFACLFILARELLAGTPAADARSKARFTWQAACDFMLEHLHRPLSRKDVARHLGVHPNHLSRLFADCARETFSEFLQARRLERARLLLADPRLNIAQVAHLSGFGSANYFTRLFRAHTGRTPTRVRVEGK
jgi:AraC-like DNA-binding protein